MLAHDLPYGMPDSLPTGHTASGYRVNAIFDVGTEPEYMASRRDGIAPAVGFLATNYETRKSGNDFAAFQFRDDSRWPATATNGGGLQQGDPTTLRWSFVPDGTSIFGFNGEPTSPSNLIAFMGSIYGVTSSDANYTDEPWFPLFDSYLNRWAQVTGLTYVYEPNDDGAALGSAIGLIGVRGDIRIGGHLIDGASRVLAYNFFPSSGSDMVIDTGDATFFGNTANNSRALRNVLAHENGHGIGLDHVCPTIGGVNGRLMEPIINLAIDGPQFDDILGAQRGYGDAFEKNGGNNSSATATALGPVVSGETIQRGTNANDNQVVPAEVDFVSIDDDSDVDFFSFSVSTGITVDLTLTPLGPTYLSGPQNFDGSCSAGTSFNAAAQSDLTLQLLAPNGITVLQSSNVNGLQGAESISSGALSAGTYFVRVSGSANAVQMYRLALTAKLIPGVVVTPSAQSTDVREGGLTDTYSLSLTTVPTGAVQVTVMSDSQTQVSSDGLNFSNSLLLSFNGIIPQTVTVRAIDDAVSEGPHAGSIGHAITASDDPGSYPVGMPLGNLMVRIADNDLSPFVRQMPLGSLVGTSLTNLGSIASATDEAVYSISLQAGQKISASVIPTGSAILSIQLVGETGQIAASSAGAAAILPATTIISGGAYSLRVGSNASSSYNLNVFLNSISEVTDSSSASRLAIDSTVLSIGNGRYAVVGDAQPTLSPSVQFTKTNAPSLFVDISATGTPLGLSDDGVAVIASTVGNSLFPAGLMLIDNNGVIISGGAPSAGYENLSLPTNLFGNALVPFWDDIDSETGNVFWQQRQINGINALVVQWENRPHFNNVGNATFQVQLFESGPIHARYVYRDVNFGNALYDGGASATVGLQLAANSALQYSFNAASLVNGDVLEFVRPILPDVDEFTVNLTGQAGKPVDIFLVGIGNDFSGQQLQLIGADGTTVLATGKIDPVQSGMDASNLDLAILGFIVPASGIYTLRVTSAQIGGKYLVTVSTALALEAEPNNLTSNPLRSISPTQPALGALNISSDPDDHFWVPLNAGEALTLSTATPFDSALSPLSNSLNPELTVIHPDETTTVGADLDSLDGKNARLTFAAPVTGAYAVRVRATAGSGEYILLLAQTAIVGRSIFYDNSFFDGNTPGASASDDSAIAPDKLALRSGTASLANINNHSRGINGLMVDIVNPASTVTAADFEFRVGNTDTPANWATGPVPSQVAVRAGAGANNSNRVTLIWPDNAIEKTWLQVTVKASANTGLAVPDVFYFGSAIGDIGNSTTDAIVNATDIAGVVGNQNSFLNPAPLASPYDFNRDRQINATDIATAVANQTSFLSALRMISPGSGGGVARAILAVGTSSKQDAFVAGYSDSETELAGPTLPVETKTRPTLPRLSEPEPATKSGGDRPFVSSHMTPWISAEQSADFALRGIPVAIAETALISIEIDDRVELIDSLMADLDIELSFER